VRGGHWDRQSAPGGECERRTLGQTDSTERRVLEGDIGKHNQHLEESVRGGHWDRQSAPRGESEGALGQTDST